MPFLGFIYVNGSGGETQVHTHSWSYANESAHPHREYRYCSCGAKEYTGNTQRVSSCTSCYPLGNVSLTRSFVRTEKNAAFYRNSVSNANSYTLTLYRNGAIYNTYNMNSTTYTVYGLSSGTYTATLTAKNTNTGQSKSTSCSSFTLVDTYPVTDNANGGTNAPSAQTKIKDENMTITTQEPKRAHYIFKGWASSKTATEAQYEAGGTYTKNTPITLYAVWEPETYTIDFDTNGGKGEAESTTITYGNSMKMPNSIVKDSYYLKGWSKTKNTSVADYKIGIDYQLEENMTLYAVWGNSTWGGSVAAEFAGGDGTKENPYQISNASELAHLADKVNQQTAAPEYEYYILTDNINLGHEEWTPIGLHDYESQYFCGSFDGNGYTISDLYIPARSQQRVRQQEQAGVPGVGLVIQHPPFDGTGGCVTVLTRPVAEVDIVIAVRAVVAGNTACAKLYCFAGVCFLRKSGCRQKPRHKAERQQKTDNSSFWFHRYPPIILFFLKRRWQGCPAAVFHLLLLF